MSNTPRNSAETNQFIRPKFNLVSAAKRLASRGEGFANSDKLADAVSAGVAVEFRAALIDALGNSYHACSANDLCTVAELLCRRRGPRMRLMQGQKCLATWPMPRRKKAV